MSKYLFGRGCRLPLALWILDHPKDRFYQSEPPRSIGVQTAVTQELQRLVDAEMLEREEPDGENRVYYIRTASPAWRIIDTAREVVQNNPHS